MDCLVQNARGYTVSNWNEFCGLFWLPPNMVRLMFVVNVSNLS